MVEECAMVTSEGEQVDGGSWCEGLFEGCIAGEFAG
jgi:hypothetical protein